MSYKDINEKYRKILEKDSQKRKIEEEKELNEVLDTNKKKALDAFKGHKKEVDKLMKQIEKGIINITGDFMMGKFKGWGGVADIERVKKDLKNIAEYL